MYNHPENVQQAVANTPGVAGDLVLGAALTGYAALAAGDDGKSHVISVRAGAAWEVRRDCVYDHATTTLTRGTLVSSSTGAAIDLPAGATLKIGPAGYEMDRLPLADLDGSGNAIRVRDGNGNKFALLPLDANDNVLVNIGLRQNTLANLLALDGLPGEVSVATDVAALVAHTGVAGQAKAHRQDTLIARATCGSTNTSAGNTAVSANLSTTVYGAAGVIDGANDVWTIPAGAYWQRLTVSGRLSVGDGEDADIGDIWRIYTELESGVGTGIYAEQPSLGGFTHQVAIAGATANGQINFSWSSLVYVGASNGWRGRLRLINNSANNWLFKTFTLRLGLEFYAQP